MYRNRASMDPRGTPKTPGKLQGYQGNYRDPGEASSISGRLQGYQRGAPGIPGGFQGIPGELQLPGIQR